MIWRSLRLLVIAAMIGVLVWDTRRAPARQVCARLAISAIHAYQHTVSPLAGSAGLQCRFTPTCSKYAETVIARDGLVAGSWRTLTRIVRCGPWTPLGTVDQP
jgi:putative membrane protein insertion efficiency factor